LALPNSVESLTSDAIQSATQTGGEFVAQSGLAEAASDVSNEGFAESFVDQALGAIERPESSPMEALKQWTQAANPAAGLSALFEQAEPQAKAQSPTTEVAAARNDKITTATRATSARITPDLDDIARRVYPILKRRLDAERRRELF
jgi:hypothetical protein